METINLQMRAIFAPKGQPFSTPEELLMVMNEALMECGLGAHLVFADSPEPDRWTCRECEWQGPRARGERTWDPILGPRKKVTGPQICPNCDDYVDPL